LFTGIVQVFGEITAIDKSQSFWDLTIKSSLATRFKLGDSVMTNGVCLTVSEIIDAEHYVVQVIPETLAATNLGELEVGDFVNLEESLRLNDALHGHFVLGHVDTTVVITEIRRDQFVEIFFELPEPGLAYAIVKKGSVCLNGVSLTVSKRTDQHFAVALIPETLERTTFGALEVGALVNLEIDMIARYLAGILANRQV
jgi:riboflavin synthase